MSGYGSWVKHQDDVAPAQATTTTESQTPATDRAQAHYGKAAVITAILGFAPGFQALWVATGLCLLVLLVSPVVGSLEASSKAQARANGGGGCQVAIAVAILLGLFALFYLVGLTTAGAS